MRDGANLGALDPVMLSGFRSARRCLGPPQPWLKHPSAVVRGGAAVASAASSRRASRGTVIMCLRPACCQSALPRGRPSAPRSPRAHRPERIAELVVEHLEQLGFEIDESDQVMRKRPPSANHGQVFAAASLLAERPAGPWRTAAFWPPR